VGAPEALEILETGPCDVIISDFRMPEMDGGDLLAIVQERYPSTVRMILSGHTDETDLLRVVLLAHQLVNKPCPIPELTVAIERMLALRATLSDETIRREILGINALPSPPATLNKLFEILDSENASTRTVATVLERDPAIAAKVLQVVNASSSGTTRRVADIGQAVALLGMRNVRALILLHDLATTFTIDPSIPPSWISNLTKHGVQVSRLARRLAGTAPWADTAFAAGLLHEVGQLVLASSRPKGFAACLAAWSRGEGTLRELELDAFGIDHSQAGAYLLGLWGLPVTVIEALESHSAPDAPLEPTGPGEAVAIAHTMVEITCGPVCGEHHDRPDATYAPTDPRRLDQLASWCRSCRECAVPKYQSNPRYQLARSPR
jgi:HD-like signal output (HDOD) protein